MFVLSYNLIIVLQFFKIEYAFLQILLVKIANKLLKIFAFLFNDLLYTVVDTISNIMK